MRLLINVLFLSFSIIFSNALAEEEPFYDGENVVGYVKDDKGNKYIVIETPNGRAKLIRTNRNPEEILEQGYGITKKDFENR